MEECGKKLGHLAETAEEDYDAKRAVVSRDDDGNDPVVTRFNAYYRMTRWFDQRCGMHF